MAYPSLKGRVVVITGAAGGIGRAVARRLAAEGARLALWDRDAARLAAIADEIGGEALSVAYEQADLASVEAATGATLAHCRHTEGGRSPAAGADTSSRLRHPPLKLT